ncbi:hypothetical protein BDR04DRAFT_1117314 [Suillus decipiens]|nr:hypothetical protein BDR04DRAFT_1117314 [Suillus decipiens]
MPSNRRQKPSARQMYTHTLLYLSASGRPLRKPRKDADGYLITHGNPSPFHPTLPERAKQTPAAGADRRKEYPAEVPSVLGGSTEKEIQGPDDHVKRIFSEMLGSAVMTAIRFDLAENPANILPLTPWIPGNDPRGSMIQRSRLQLRSRRGTLQD